MSVQIDYWTIAVIAGASGFFGAFGTELAKFLIGEFKARRKDLVRVLKNGNEKS